MTVFKCSGIILTNGPGNSEPKAAKALRRLCNVLRPLTRELILVTPDPVRLIDHDAMIVRNHYEPYNTLTALHAGLFNAGSTHGVVLSSHLPLVRSRVVKTLIEVASAQWDLIAGTPGKTPAPFPAVYSKTYIKRIEIQLAKGNCEMAPLMKKVSMKTISEKKLRQKDTDLTSYLSLKNPEHTEKILKLLETELSSDTIIYS
ncbi:MAG: NTP transferase domain-containing protein [Desulfobacteraceae bacterium]|nr:NTP transferase domain-containing protein [Desulfobacteraceae bacterium]